MSEKEHAINTELLQQEIRFDMMRNTAGMIAEAARDRFPNRYRSDREFAQAWSDFTKQVLHHTFGDHSQSLLWLLAEIFHRHDPSHQAVLARKINLEDAQSTLRDLGLERIAEGVRVAEVAGDEYAGLIHRIGGQSASWRSREFQELNPGEQPKISDTKSFCDPENATEYFEPESYDYFLAVGYGNLNNSNLQEVANKLLKPDRRKNVWITRDQYGSIEPFVRS